MSNRAVAVSAQSSNDWALLVTAAQEGNSRRIVPMIWISGSSLILTKIPKLNLWREAGLVRVLRDSHFSPEQRTAQLRNIVAGAVEDVQKQYRDFFLHKETPGVITHAVMTIVGRFKELPNFPVTDEPAYSWLLAHDELAHRAHQFLRYLALGDSGTIPALTDSTFEERAAAAEEAILRGAGAREVHSYADVKDFRRQS